MKRHPFEPARLVCGFTALALGIGYGLDALGIWYAPGLGLFLALPAGLLLAGATATVWARTRRHRTRDTDEPPAPQHP
ncbi:hypothetical protein ACWD6P_25360 [Streptomyces sp. NPDC002446]